ncbi:MAG: DUF6435 family protein [Kangiellaceae bacterium]|jgi:hypothetical protein|nr:DUF6435 family protein [Kangiellaceae bacterium]
MFSFFKSDPVKKLNKKVAILQEQAMHAQRKGDIELYSKLTMEAEQLLKEIADIQMQE